MTSINNMPSNTFDLKGFLNDPKVQANKAGAIQYLQKRGIIDQQGKPLPQFGDAQRPQKGFSAPTSLQKLDPTNTVAPQALAQSLPLIGSIGGTAFGAAGGALAGGPVGAYAGGVVGSGVGAATGQMAANAMMGAPATQGAAKTGEQYAAFEAIGGPVMKVAGKVVETAGAKLAKSVIPKSEYEANLLQIYRAKPGNSR
jgi:hypothetical protein